MTALDHTSHAISAGARTIAAVARLTDGVRMVMRVLLNRRQVNHLRLLSDHQLADIGLMRADLDVVSQTPLGIDPTARLTAIARERSSVEYGARRVC